MTYATKELAERKGKEEAERLTRRGYPTKFLEARPVTSTIMALDGQSPSEMTYTNVTSQRWEAVLSE